MKNPLLRANDGVRDSQETTSRDELPEQDQCGRVAILPEDEYLRTVRQVIEQSKDLGQSGLFINADTMEARLAAFRALLPGATPVYDMSRNDDPLVVAKVLQLGCDFSAWAGYHLRMANILGIPRGKMRLASPLPHKYTFDAALETCPAAITIDSLAALERVVARELANRNHREAHAFDVSTYRPTLVVKFRVDNNQPYAHPRHASTIFRRALAEGFRSFGISATVDTNHGSIHSYRNVLTVCEQVLRGVSSNEIQLSNVIVAGGLVDPRSLANGGVDPTGFLLELARELNDFQNIAATLGFQAPISVEIGRWLVGEFYIAAQVTGTREINDTRQVFVEESRYGGLNRSMYGGQRIEAVALPRANGLPSFRGSLCPTVIQLASCDSVDALDDERMLPSDISVGLGDIPPDWIAFGPGLGADSISSALDFNMIECPGVVMYSSRNGQLEITPSPFLRKQRFILDAAEQWNADQKRTRLFEDLLDSIPAKAFEYHEGETLARWHAKVARVILDTYGPDKPGEVATRVTKVRASQAAPEIRNGQSFLIVDGMQIVTTIEYILDHMGVDILCIAQKAQNDPLVVALECAVNRHLQSRGKATPDLPRVWMDTASAAEMKVAIANGFSPKHMIVSHPRKTAETLQLIRELKPAAFTFDSDQELARVLKYSIVPSDDYQPIAIVRIKTSGQGAVNNLSAKFGCSVSEAVELLISARDHGFCRLGIAFHVGTQCCRPASYEEALFSVQEVIQQAQRKGITISIVDIGGGFPDARKAARERTTQQQLIRDIGEKVNAFRAAIRQLTGTEIFILCEPGRIITDRGTIVTEVLGGDASSETMLRRIRIGDHKSGGLSGTVHDEQSFDIRIVPRGIDEESFQKELMTTLIFGATGYPNDQFHYDGAPYQVPSNIRAGDHLVIPCTGSYSSSAGAISHGIEPPSPFMILGQKELIRSPWASKNSIYLQALLHHQRHH